MSEAELHLIESHGTDPEPVAALRQALSAAAKAMMAKSVPPTALVAMTWSGRQPAAIHPSSTVVDLSYRETFGGFRPPIDVRFGDHDGVCLTLRAHKTAPSSPEPVWGSLSRAELAREYSPRALVPDMGAVFDLWRNDGAAFRAQHLTAELFYGPSPAETLDVYLPESATGALPLWVFIHGGYWQAADKAQHGQFAAGMLAKGYAVAIPNYTLAPAAPIAVILKQMQAMLSFLAREASALGCDPNELHISGHSAGGQLAAMLACLPEGRLIRSSLPLSGLFDLAPLVKLPFGPMLGLDSDVAAAALSPQYMKPLPHIRVGAAVGGGESREFKRQTADFARAWAVPSHEIGARHHFDLLEELNGGVLLDFALDIARIGR